MPPEIAETISPVLPAPAAAPRAMNQDKRRAKFRFFRREVICQNGADLFLHRSGIRSLPIKTTRPLGCGRPKGLVIWAARTATLSPEIKEGSIPHYLTTTHQTILSFLFGFLLCLCLLLSCHRHLLLKLPLVGIYERGEIRTQAKRIFLVNPPHIW